MFYLLYFNLEPNRQSMCPLNFLKLIFPFILFQRKFHICEPTYSFNVLSRSFAHIYFKVQWSNSRQCYFCDSPIFFLQGDIKKTFAQDSRLFIPPLPPCLFLFVFEHLPLPKVRSFWLELTLSSAISILVKFREKRLIMSTSILG